MALPLVPVELVKNAYDEILNCKPAITNKDLRNSVQRYLNYFEKQWLKDNYIKIWNHFDTMDLEQIIIMKRAISGYEADNRKKKDIEKDLKIETLIKEVEDDKIDLIEYVSEVSKLFQQ